MNKFVNEAICVFTMFLAIVSVATPTLAQYSPPVPPTSIIIRETFIAVSYTESQQVFAINVTEFDSQQRVEEVLLSLKEPVLNVSFTIYLISETPTSVPELPNRVVLLYFAIRAHETLLENIDPVNITFAVEKALAESKSVDEKTITVHTWLGIFEGGWQELPTSKAGENDSFFFFEAESLGLSYFAVSGIVPQPSFPWLAVVLIVVVAAGLIVAWIYYHRRRGPRLAPS